MMNWCWRRFAQPGERCLAQTRKGTPCKAKALLTTGRCKMHGNGGPRSEAGKARAKENLKLRWKKR
jgi:hypothetical protein